MEECKKFVRALVVQLNAGRRERLRHEMQVFVESALARRGGWKAMKRERVKVDSRQPDLRGSEMRIRCTAV